MNGVAGMKREKLLGRWKRKFMDDRQRESRLDADGDSGWITTESGAHVLINNGTVVGGAGGNLTGRTLSGAQSQTSKSSGGGKSKSQVFNVKALSKEEATRRLKGKRTGVQKMKFTLSKTEDEGRKKVDAMIVEALKKHGYDLLPTKKTVRSRVENGLLIDDWAHSLLHPTYNPHLRPKTEVPAHYVETAKRLQGENLKDIEDLKTYSIRGKEDSEDDSAVRKMPSEDILRKEIMQRHGEEIRGIAKKIENARKSYESSLREYKQMLNQARKEHGITEADLK